MQKLRRLLEAVRQVRFRRGEVRAGNGRTASSHSRAGEYLRAHQLRRRREAVDLEGRPSEAHRDRSEDHLGQMDRIPARPRELKQIRARFGYFIFALLVRARKKL